jgi:serine/threonine protein phosphatase PrpC
MSETKQYIEALFNSKQISVANNRNSLFEEFSKSETMIAAVKLIKENQALIMKNWKLKSDVNNIIDKQIIIPNANVGKEYEVKLDFLKLGIDSLKYTEIKGLEQYGLSYDNESETIKGIPSQSGDFKVEFRFRIEGESDDSTLNVKPISIVINADPKSLWKEIPSDLEKDEDWKVTNYWKADRISDIQKIGDKSIVVASTRGRSHANVGSFRDDDFAFKFFENTGWSVISVADGAGSAKFSRQGSKLACDAIIEYFDQNLTSESFVEFDKILKMQHENPNEESSKSISYFVYDNLSKAAYLAHKKIADFANKAEKQIKDFHSTLIFALYKKYDFGYAILSFGVGDCPIGLLNKDLTEIKLMNWLDVGEFGGGTRFITMPEIFSSDKFSSRFGFKLIDDFSFLMLMTDGIYDPKFVVEANLEKIEKWKEFIDDLGGNNAEKVKVDFVPFNKDITDQLLCWMDFWSAGNHDDRTLAVIF